MLARCAIPLLALALATGPGPFPGDVRSTPTGDVWVKRVDGGAGKPRQSVGRGTIDAPPERVWRALTDVAHWQEFMPFLESSDAQPQRDGSVLSHQVLALPAPLGRRRYQVRFTQRIENAAKGSRTWHLDWAYVPGTGNVTDHRGSWTLTALSAGETLGICRLSTDPGGLTPRWAMDRGTLQMLPWVFHGLRQHLRRSRYDDAAVSDASLPQRAKLTDSHLVEGSCGHHPPHELLQLLLGIDQLQLVVDIFGQLAKAKPHLLEKHLP